MCSRLIPSDFSMFDLRSQRAHQRPARIQHIRDIIPSSVTHLRQIDDHLLIAEGLNDTVLPSHHLFPNPSWLCMIYGRSMTSKAVLMLNQLQFLFSSTQDMSTLLPFALGSILRQMALFSPVVLSSSGSSNLSW